MIPNPPRHPVLFAVFVLCFIVGFMAAFEVKRQRRAPRGGLEPVNRRIVDMVKRQA